MVLEIIIFTLFTVLSLTLSFSTLISIPGGWIFLALGILLEVFDQKLGLPKTSFGTWILISTASLLAIAELIELAASMLGSKFGGGSKKGMWGSFIGAILGAIIGTLFIPIPLFGSLVGSLWGAFIGAYMVERTQQDESGDALKAAVFATIGRLFGTFGKFGLSFVAATIMIIALVRNYF